MIIVSDTREQKPFSFKKLNIKEKPEVKRAALKTGDYSIEGYEDRVCIERISMVDLFGSCGQGRDRFEREFQRMSKFEYAALVVEVDWKQMYKYPPARSKMSPKIILRTLLAWHMRYQVHIWPCPGRKFAEKVTYLLLDRFYRDKVAAKHDKKD
jgi:ERCC4-type nuclease